MSFWRIDLFIIRKWPSLYLIVFFVLKSTFSDIDIKISAFFWLLLTWCIFYYPHTCNLFVSLYLKWISYGQPIVVSCLFIQLENLCLLIGVFRPFTYFVFFHMVWFKSIILLLDFYFSHQFFIPFSKMFWLLWD